MFPKSITYISTRFQDEDIGHILHTVEQKLHNISRSGQRYFYFLTFRINLLQKIMTKCGKDMRVKKVSVPERKTRYILTQNVGRKP